MNAKPILVFAVSVSVLGGMAVLLGGFQHRYAEYQIRTVTTMWSLGKSDPSAGVSTISRLYFGRRDGSKGVQTTEVINGKPCTTTTYWDVRRREEVRASDCIGMRSSIPFLSHPPRPAAPVSSCAPETAGLALAGVEFIQGLRVEKLTSDNDSARAVMYVAPELGCLLVRALHYWKGQMAASHRRPSTNR
jgi:hypothetical protein